METQEGSSAALYLDHLDLACSAVANVFSVFTRLLVNSIEERTDSDVGGYFFCTVKLVPGAKAVANAKESKRTQAPDPARSSHTLSFGALAGLKCFHGVLGSVSSPISVSTVDDRKINLSLETGRGRMQGAGRRVETLEALSEARTVFLVAELASGGSFNRANANSGDTLRSVAGEVASDNRQNTVQVGFLIVQPQVPVRGTVFMWLNEASAGDCNAVVVQIALNFVPEHGQVAAAMLRSANAVIRRAARHWVGMEASRKRKSKESARQARFDAQLLDAGQERPQLGALGFFRLGQVYEQAARVLAKSVRLAVDDVVRVEELLLRLAVVAIQAQRRVRYIPLLCARNETGANVSELMRTLSVSRVVALPERGISDARKLRGGRVARDLALELARCDSNCVVDAYSTRQACIPVGTSRGSIAEFTQGQIEDAGIKRAGVVRGKAISCFSKKRETSNCIRSQASGGKCRFEKMRRCGSKGCRVFAEHVHSERECPREYVLKKSN